MNTPKTVGAHLACWQPEWVAGRAYRAEFLDRLGRTAREAADGGATLLITPEMSATGYHLGRARTAELAEPEDGPLADGVRAIAAATGLAIVYGWPERDGDAVHNSVQLVEPSGKIAARYRKTHLYGDFDRSAFRAGDELVVQADVNGLRVGLLVCYDVEFPESVRAHALAGTELLVVPTALVRPWEFVARTLVAARAFESQLYVAYVNWFGSAPDSYCGLSRVCGPDGQVVAEAHPGQAESLLFAPVDRAAIRAARRDTPYLVDRRTDLYGDAL